MPTEVLHIRVNSVHIAEAIKHCIKNVATPASKAEAVRLLFEERLLQICGMDVFNTDLTAEHQRLLNRYTKRQGANTVRNLPAVKQQALMEEGETLDLMREAMRQVEIAEEAPTVEEEVVSHKELLFSSMNPRQQQVYTELEAEGADVTLLDSAAEAPDEILKIYLALSKSLEPIEAYTNAIKEFCSRHNKADKICELPEPQKHQRTRATARPGK